MNIYQLPKPLRSLSAPWQLIVLGTGAIANVFLGYFADWWPVKEANMVVSLLLMLALNLDWLDVSEEDQPK